MPVQGKAAGPASHRRCVRSGRIALSRPERCHHVYGGSEVHRSGRHGHPELVLAGVDGRRHQSKTSHNGDKITQGAIPPAFFENLLPEGALLGV